VRGGRVRARHGTLELVRRGCTLDGGPRRVSRGEALGKAVSVLASGHGARY
jgi:hypothetical protein